MGGAGNLFIGLVTFSAMGWLHDHYTVENLPAALRDQVVLQGRVDEGSVEALDAHEKQSVKDAQKIAASTTFRCVAALPVLLTLIFGAILLHDLRRGGYKQEVLLAPGGGDSP
jgi:hypothetical protein